MDWLVQAGLANAAAATVLGLLAFVVSRYFRRPALTHALWVLVLIKLVTPPIVEIPIPLEVAATESLERDPPTVSEPALVTGPEVLAPTAPESPRTRESVDVPSSRDTAPGPQVAAAKSAAVPSTAAPAAPAAEPEEVATTASHWWALVRRPAALALLLPIWGLGCTVVAVALVIHLVRFRRLVRTAAHVGPAVQKDVDDLAASLSLRRSPPVLLAPWTCSPMLWGCGRAVRLLFPAALWDELDDESREALLLHELAHYRRGDHWVRLLELAATVLYWWHPVVWWGRREIAIVEEECCDAWAIERFADSPRIYADALLATLDFIAERRPVLPPAGSGIGDLPVLKRRLTQIMRRSVQRSLGTGARWCLTVLAVVALPLHPVLALLPTSSADASLSTARVVPGASSLRTEALPPSSAIETNQTGSTGAPIGSPDRQMSPVPIPTGWWNARPSQRWAAATAPGERYRLVAEVGHRVRLEHLEQNRQFDLGPAKLTSAAFLPDGRQFVAGSLDRSVRLWDAGSGEAVSLLGWHDAEVRTVAVSADGRWAVSGSADGAVFVWEVASGRIVHAWSEPGRPIVSVGFSPDGRRAAIAAGGWQDASGQIAVLETHDWKEVRRFATPSLAVVEYAPDGSLFSADWTGRLLRWNPSMDQPELWGAVDKELVSAASFSPDNRILEQSRL